MKEIITNKFKILTADLIDSPPVNREKDRKLKTKKKKIIYQLNTVVDDV